MRSLKALSVLGLLSLLLSPHLANAWGKLGHQTVATLAAQLVQNKYSFWTANASGMGTLTNVPDANWKIGAQAPREKPNHWFQLDYYTNDPLNFKFPRSYPTAVKTYKEDVVIANGTAPWRIKQLYDLAVKAFKKKDYATGLQMAGTMSHYIGDLSQPLHVSKNYDGNETGNPGIHKFFESTNIEAADKTKLISDVKALAKKLLANPKFVAQFDGTLMDIAFEEINRSTESKDIINENDLKLGRGSQGASAQLILAKNRLADGVATLTLVLEKLSEDASLFNNSATVNVSVPAWVAPSFNNIKKSKSFYNPSEREKFISSLNGDDCEENSDY